MNNTTQPATPVAETTDPAPGHLSRSAPLCIDCKHACVGGSYSSSELSCNHPIAPVSPADGRPSIPCWLMRQTELPPGEHKRMWELKTRAFYPNAGCGMSASLFAARAEQPADIKASDQPVPMPAPVPTPAIGHPWPGIEGSAYAGLSRGEDGQPDAHLVLLPDEPETTLDWKAAKAWAHSVGGQLPTRRESALLYAHVFDKVDPSVWYWTATQYSYGYAWGQYFRGGFQYDNDKKYEARARAVRRFPA